MDTEIAPHEARTIPLIEIDSAASFPSVALMEAAPERLADIMASAKQRYGRIALNVGDALSARWIEKTGNPYAHEIAAIASKVETPGSFLLNLSYEWTCTASVGADPELGGIDCCAPSIGP